jgi:hypothetical protein
MALQAAAEKRDAILVPSANASEAAVVDGLNVFPINSLAEAVGFLSSQVDMDPHSIDLDEVFRQLAHTEDDFVDIKGQDYAKRALLIAASGTNGRGGDEIVGDEDHREASAVRELGREGVEDAREGDQVGVDGVVVVALVRG